MKSILSTKIQGYWLYSRHFHVKIVALFSNLKIGIFKFYWCIMLVLLTTILNASTTYARPLYITSDDIRKTYLRTDVGYSYSHLKHSSDYEEKTNDSAVVDIGIGYKINPIIKVDTIAYYRVKYKHKDKFTIDTTNYSAKQDISNLTLMLNGYFTPRGLWHCPPRYLDYFDPYLTAGVGLAINKSGDIVTVSSEETRTTLGKNTRNLAWQVGIGCLFEVVKYVAIDFMYKYVDLGNIKTHKIQDNTGGVSYADPVTGKLRVHELSLGINFEI
ncbi:MAG: porin family protein [Rickettsiales bacterium]|nr:porin family protein [Rickettsiales bacterium]